MTARTLAALLIALALPPTATAEPLAAAEVLKLRLTEAVDLALDRNPTVRRARETINEFNLLVRQVRADALPQLDLTLSAQRFRDPGLRNSPAFGDLPDFLPPEALGAYSFDDYAYSHRHNRCGEGEKERGEGSCGHGVSSVQPSLSGRRR